MILVISNISPSFYNLPQKYPHCQRNGLLSEQKLKHIKFMTELNFIITVSSRNNVAWGCMYLRTIYVCYTNDVCIIYTKTAKPLRSKVSVTGAEFQKFVQFYTYNGWNVQRIIFIHGRVIDRGLQMMPSEGQGHSS